MVLSAPFTPKHLSFFRHQYVNKRFHTNMSSILTVLVNCVAIKVKKKQGKVSLSLDFQKRLETLPGKQTKAQKNQKTFYHLKDRITGHLLN